VIDMKGSQADRWLRVLLVDPSLFTAPYDAALTEGLVGAGIRPTWATRPKRAGDRQEIPEEYVDDFFYRNVDSLTTLPKLIRSTVKGIAHVWGLIRLVVRVWRQRPDIVHVQWVVLPPLDIIALWLIGRVCPIVLTAHDTVPFNGLHVSLLHNLGFNLPLRLADAVIVHTATGQRRLVERGIDAHKIHVIPHGPLKLPVSPSRRDHRHDARYTFTLFGELKPYKGIDLLVEAAAKLDASVRSGLRIVIAGREWMDLTAIRGRIAELELQATIDLRAQRQTDQQMADLFDETDCFVFPYRQVDASGVYYLVKGLGKWMVASRVGVFAEDMVDGRHGRLIDPESVDQLTDAMEQAFKRAERVVHTPGEDMSWRAIGRATAALYDKLARRGANRAGGDAACNGRATSDDHA
jgi:glycosyltransferase involved in cell wall biosynthesis